MDAPRENLIRASFPGVELREGDGKHLTGYFARFGEWNLIDSAVEGRFLERIAPGAFTKTLAEKPPKILFQHGQDPEIGNKVIATPRGFPVDDIGPMYDADLLDGLPPLVVSGLRAGAYGSSYRFSIPKGKDDWTRSAAKSAHNPEGLDERTIREAMVFEAGPVTWPADAGTTASVRSLTDAFMLDKLTTDPSNLAAVVATMTAAALPPGGAEVTHSDEGSREVSVTPEASVTFVGPSRSEIVTEPLNPADRPSRISELEETIKRQATENTGRMPNDVQAAYDANKAELAELRLDEAAWQSHKADVLEIENRKPQSTERSYEIPTVTRTKTEADIYNPDQFSGIGFRSIEERNQQLRDNAMRSLDTSRFAKSANHDALAELLDSEDEMNEKGLPELASRMLVTGSPIYRRAFAKLLRYGSKDAWTPEETRAAALAVTGTTTTGGYAVPYVFDPTIIHLGVFTAENPFRSACRIETITAGNNWRTVTASEVAAVYATEALAAVEAGPTFGQPTYTVQRAQAFVTVSIETLEDRSDITGELTRLFAEGKATLEENKFAIGVGTTVYPMGMFTDTAYTNQDTATNDVTAIADLLVLEGALPLRFRANGAFFMNRSTLRQLMALDTTYRYFSGAGIQFAGQNQPNGNGGGNTGLQCLGYPVWEVPSAVSTLTTDGAIIVVFVDPKSYIIVDRIGMNVEVIPNMLNGATPSFPTGQRGIYAYWRNTAKPVAADAGRSLSVQ